MIHRDEPPHAHPTVGHLLAALAVILIMMIMMLVTTRDAQASSTPVTSWPIVTATWYGPGLYGNTTACGQRYTQTIRGVAHRSLPCGSKLTIVRRGVRLRLRVIDRGPFSHATFDLSARTAQDLCRCWAPYTMQVRWKRGWS